MLKTKLLLPLIIVLFAFANSGLQARVELGSDMLEVLKFEPLRGKRVGLLTNPSGINSRGVSTIQLLHRAPEVNLVALFGAEHGLDGKASAGKEVRDGTDPVTGLPVFSLYGPGPIRKPTEAMLRRIDILVYDLQDTGARSYTFISSMGMAMNACGKAGVEFMVLDRPNPLGGIRVEGPLFNPRFRSMVGQWPIPYVYGMTCGELARLLNKEGMIEHPCVLYIVPMRGWKRDMVWRDTGLSWKPTSPLVPHAHSPLFQVAMGMVGEIGGLDLGFGTQMPFELFGSAWLDANKVSRYLNALKLPGLNFRAIKTTIARGRYKGKTIPAVKVDFIDPVRAPLTPVNLYVIEAMRKEQGKDMIRIQNEAGKNWGLFDKVNGTNATRLDLQVGRSVDNIVESWRHGLEKFQSKRLPYLIYRSSK
ncbi:MAG: DUF1343 domain-containing protein [Verrucomicrobia bacterium]|jgi:uncharacterized protein YbbC (DUF1343 family)|nr:DUF1343 domain-containing protein [Verrucomicrobiota bacterium]MBT4273797.1 DUF1343 domain-containing protein [Verrucomicrobiota bacterium]MBT5481046.1 DUF1343 domain-containing protein [Verrucomicrobiota bacterium]MBT7535157.1 DUF1343 domain-containing protein [Verrucomicrobiota bacterium]MBT7873155.1 DUF1343 domain-containing protein [Verrucomicrobiota bacterium]